MPGSVRSASKFSLQGLCDRKDRYAFVGADPAAAIEADDRTGSTAGAEMMQSHDTPASFVEHWAARAAGLRRASIVKKADVGMLGAELRLAAGGDEIAILDRDRQVAATTTLRKYEPS